MPEVIEVDGIKSVRLVVRSRMFNLRPDISPYHDTSCDLCGLGSLGSADAYRYIPGRTRTIYDREK